jgi:hypothetical protein
MRADREWFSSKSESPTRGKSRNRSAVNRKTGTDRLQVTSRKRRLITRRLRRMRGTSTGRPVRSRAPWR